jgi:hypothetical protein
MNPSRGPREPEKKKAKHIVSCCWKQSKLKNGSSWHAIGKVSEIDACSVAVVGQ